MERNARQNGGASAGANIISSLQSKSSTTTTTTTTRSTFNNAIGPLVGLSRISSSSSRSRRSCLVFILGQQRKAKLSVAATRLSNLVSVLATSLLIIMLALTGFVCTHKIQAEEECLSSNVLCYECNSGDDPNCADPFDFSPTATLPDEPILARTNYHGNNNNTTTALTSGSLSELHCQQQANNLAIQSLDQIELTNPDQTNHTNQNNSTNNNNDTIPAAVSKPHSRRKKLPVVAVCHGCCVKITSKLSDGVTYVKRTCTTNLQINYFMVDLICMRQSGYLGKMCFCETDYCNGQSSNQLPQLSKQLLVLLLTIISLILLPLSDY